LVFGQLINLGTTRPGRWSFLIGAALMAGAGLVELSFGIACEQRSLEELALPLTMAEAERREESARAEQAGGSPNPAPEGDAGREIAGRA
jgi:hypothetical protein